MAEKSKGVLMIVDHEPLKSVTLKKDLLAAGYSVLDEISAGTALSRLTEQPIDVVIANASLPDGQGLRFLEQVRFYSPRTHIILMSDSPTVELAVEAMKFGIFDFLRRPIVAEVLLQKLDHLRASRRWISNPDPAAVVDRIGNLSARSVAMRRLIEQIRAVADNERPMLIQGETGVGKQRVAEAVHAASRRASKPLVRVACGALSNANGHGADTSPRISFNLIEFEQAAGGTLLLMEVDALPRSAQALLLETLESADAAGNGTAAAHPRVLALARRDLKALVASGEFREDLYYRLSAVTLTVPPLRDRREDIPLLVDAFLKSHPSRQQGSAARTISPHALEKLAGYSWPHNVRELHAVLERALAFAQPGEEIGPVDIELPNAPAPAPSVSLDLPGIDGNLTEAVAGVERRLITEALHRAAGNQAKAAQYLGIPRTTLRDKMTKYGMIGQSQAAEMVH